jgi:hypothetical protein
MALNGKARISGPRHRCSYIIMVVTAAGIYGSLARDRSHGVSRALPDVPLCEASRAYGITPVQSGSPIEI